MPIYNLTKDKIDEFNKLLNDKKEEFESLKGKNNKTLWLDDLNNIEKQIKSNTKKTFKFKVGK